jgi:hypothetical protein
MIAAIGISEATGIDAADFRRMMKWILAAVLAIALVGCAHAPNRVVSKMPETREDPRMDVLNAIVAHWMRGNQDRKVFRYIDPELCALPIVSKLRREGFMIFSKDEPRPPRNSWDTDESRTWYDLKVGEIKIGARWSHGACVDNLEWRFSGG